MGVPAFFRWLTEKYPKVMEDVLEERLEILGFSDVDGKHNVADEKSVDCTRPNPSGLETDNLYVDMNGIIHPCSHPEVGPQPETEVEMYDNVCKYVSRLVRVVRPRRMLYLAIDGVAPRAKMNQQRSRRFRSAQETRELQEIEDDIRADLLKQGCAIPDQKKKKQVWDSNVITPGTKFMLGLSQHVRHYIRQQQASSDYWKSIMIVFTDASIPGEGEHKIMTHMRHQKSQPNYNPNMVHVLHGLDADLIMLALASHEINFYILREEVMFGRRGQEQSIRRKEESGFTTQQQLLDDKVTAAAMETLVENQQKPLCRLSIAVLRDYLYSEFRYPQKNFERIIDDVVFLCFFVGNDFLPHLPSLDIRDGALDFLFNVYKSQLLTQEKFLTVPPDGTVNLQNVDIILREVAKIEDNIFAMKQEQEAQEKERHKQRKANQKANLTANGKAPKASFQENAQPPKVYGRAAKLLAAKPNDTMTSLGNRNSPKSMNKKSIKIQPIQTTNTTMKVNSKKDNDTKTAENKKKRKQDESNVDEKEETPKDSKKKKVSTVKSNSNNVDEDDDLFNTDDDDDSKESTNLSSNAEDVEDEEWKKDPEEYIKKKVKERSQKKLDTLAETVQDNVKLHMPGWKDRYYNDKCKADDVENHGGRDLLFRTYIQGLCWVMKYYYDGCPSWKWYFPFHYAPFASDLVNFHVRFGQVANNIGTFDDDTTPFSPLEQLMAVLPVDSSHSIPKASRWLMGDQESPIIDFYPTTVPTDPNGKAMPWLWVVLLPFIDESRLLAAMEPTKEHWTPQEHLCNARGLDDGYLYIHFTHPLYTNVISKQLPINDNENKKKSITLSESGGVAMKGSVRLPLSQDTYKLEDSVPSPYSASKVLETISSNQSGCVVFLEPSKSVRNRYNGELYPGTIIPPSILTQDDRRIRRPRFHRNGCSIANMGITRQNHSPHQNTQRQNAPNTSHMFQPLMNYNRPPPPHHNLPPPPPPPPPQHLRWQAPPPPPPPPFHNGNLHHHHTQQPQAPYQRQPNQPVPYQRQSHQAPPPQPQRNSFRFNRQGQQQQQQQQKPRVNPKLMQSLRSQLANTLSQKRKQNK